MRETLDYLDLKNVNIPIGYCKIKGPIEDFYITIYDNKRNKFVYRVTGGNTTECHPDNLPDEIVYEVR